MPFTVYDYRNPDHIKNLLVTPEMRSRILEMEPGQGFNTRHSHDLGHEIFLILQGTAEFEIEGDIQTVEFHLAAEQIEQLLEQGRIAVRQMPPQQAPLQALLQTVVYQVASRAQLLSPGQVAEHGRLGVAALHHQQEDHEEQNHDQPGQDKQEAPIADV